MWRRGRRRTAWAGRGWAAGRCARAPGARTSATCHQSIAINRASNDASLRFAESRRRPLLSVIVNFFANLHLKL